MSMVSKRLQNGKKADKELYDFGSEYKKLPLKKRVSLIQIAKTLLVQQRKNTLLLVAK